MLHLLCLTFCLCRGLMCKGSIIGTFLGAILLQALKVGLVVCGVDTFWQYIATGLIIVFAVYVDVIQGKLAAMRLNKKAKAE